MADIPLLLGAVQAAFFGVSIYFAAWEKDFSKATFCLAMALLLKP